MGNLQYLRNHITRIRKSKSAKASADDTWTILYYGDALEILGEEDGFTKVRLTDGREGWIKGDPKRSDKPVLSFAFIDVGQGDSCLIETPCKHRILVDGGENAQAARYLAKRFQYNKGKKGEVLFDAIVITHGDADHFAGLSKLVVDAAANPAPEKKITVHAERVFHNGLVKRSANNSSGTKRKESEMFGSTEALETGEIVITDLVDDIRKIPDKDLNQHFLNWKSALKELDKRRKVTVKRLDSSKKGAFDFLEDVSVELLGPDTVRLENGKIGLPFFPTTDGGKTPSSARTINGHSIVLRIKYGNVRVLLSGDLNSISENMLYKKHVQGAVSLEAEAFKVPHHGSDDVSLDFFKAVRPFVSIISSGDENVAKDYLHPRANVLGAIGKASRAEDPLIFVTDLNAFNGYVGPALRAEKNGEEYSSIPGTKMFYARERISYGMTHLRTDGENLFVARRGANQEKIEAYVFNVSGKGEITPVKLDKI